MSEKRTIPEIRRDYVATRADDITLTYNALNAPVGNWRQAAKSQAHAEFNDMLDDVTRAAKAQVLRQTAQTVREALESKPERSDIARWVAEDVERILLQLADEWKPEGEDPWES